MGSFNTNSNNTNYTPTTTTSDQIKWTGGDITCNGEVIVCNGKNLTVVQNAIAEKICGLTNSTDISEIVICDAGGYFTEAFKDANSPITVILQQVLDAICTQKTQIENKAEKDILTTESIEITYCCCGPDNCSGKVIATIPTHLKNILDCVCAMKAEIAQIKNVLNTQVAQNCKVQFLQEQINAIKKGINDFNNNPQTNSLPDITVAPSIDPCLSFTVPNIGSATIP